MILAQNHITRLSRYKRVILQLKQAGLQQVFANNLADAAGMTAAQVRKDFSILGIYGQKKGGFQVDKLLQQLERLLGLHQQRQVILVGYGRMGAAMMDFPEFQSGQIAIKAGFDSDPEKCDPHADVPVLPMQALKSYIQETGVNLAILAVPATAAQQVANELVELGIRGILNLTSRHLRVPDMVFVNNIDLTMALESVIFHVPLQEQEDLNEEN